MHQDQQLRKILNEAPIADLVPGFDPDAGWREVDRRRNPRRKRMFLRRYIPYAAAIVAVLLLLLRPKEDASLTLIAFRNTVPRVQQTQTGKEEEDTLPAPNRRALATKPAARPAAQPVAAAQTPAPAQADNMVTTIEPDAPAQLKAALPVKHYADIAPVPPVAEEHPTADVHRKGFWRSRIARRRIAPQAGMKEETPIRGLMYAFSNKE